MTKRKVLYAVVVGIIMLAIVVYFIFLFPRDHVYNGTLVSIPDTVEMASLSIFYPG